MIEFFTIEKVIGLLTLIVFAIYFFISTEKKKKDIWKAILGEDETLQVPEIVILYWVRLFPILFFISLLIVVIEIQLNDLTSGILKTLWYALDGIFAFAIVGDAYKNKGGRSEN